jgi:CDP-diglyceride synthetase
MEQNMGMRKGDTIVVPARAISWLVLLVLAVPGILYAPQLVIILASVCCAVIATVEFCNLVHRIGWNARIWAVGSSSAITILLTGLDSWGVGPRMFVFCFVLALISLAIPYLMWINWRVVLKMMFSEVIGLTYLGFTLSYIPLITAGENGREWLLYGLVIVSATDTGAYIIGRLFGKHQLAPSISPAKTIEGALGGGATGVFFSVVMARLSSLGMGVMVSLLLGLVLSVLGQVGDLVESKLKRLAKVKDSGRIIPGQGGVLDRIDSVVLVLPVLYHIISMELT